MKNTIHNPFRQSTPRTALIYIYVGALATQFTGLDIVLAQVLASMPEAKKATTKRELASRYSEMVEALRKAAEKRTMDDALRADTDRLVARLVQAGRNRNRILHSAWAAYADGEVVQRQARPAVGEPKNITHAAFDVASIKMVIDEVMELRSDVPYLLGD